MSVGTARHRARLDPHYDAIVVGSGIGGLSTAACLAKAGQRVLVLEQHYTAGGFTHTYARKGYEWDVGVHYIGEVHRPHSVMRRIFDYISEGQLQWSQMDEVYDRVYLGHESFDFVSGVKCFRAKMLGYFPEEEAALDRYLQLVHAVSSSTSSFFMAKALPDWLAKILDRPLTHSFASYANQTTASVLSRLTKNTKMIAVLTGQWGDYGLPPQSSSFGVHALLVKHYLSGANYPVGGASSIARTIEPVIRKAGGQVVTNAEVEQVLVRGGKATGVRLRGGQEVHAKTIVSAIGAANTWRRLLDRAELAKHGMEAPLARSQPSMAHVGVYIGLKGSSQDLGLGTTNLWLYRDEHHDANLKDFMANPGMDFPVVYISFPSSKDPHWERNFPGKSTIEIVAPAPYSWFKQWEGRPWQKRGEDYTKLKASIQDSLLARLYEVHPQLVGKVDYAEVSTPLSTAHFSCYSTGELYGLDHGPQRFQERWLRPSTPIRNLYLTGQDIVSCGVGGAMVAGVLTAIKILGLWQARGLIQLLKPKRSKSKRSSSVGLTYAR
jgi:all-trans-retinol 13,14-reductase